MKIRKVEEQLELTKLETVEVNNYTVGNFEYTVSIVKNGNIIKVIKEDTKSEFFKIEYFEIVD